MTRKKDTQKKDRLKNTENEAGLLLYNDDINSFDYIISSLTEIVKHSEQQATQCAFIAHFKGSAVIETGAKEHLLHLKKQFDQRQITTIVESV